ncbi:MAG: DUF1595 domain-containing protein, partial [Nannocystaceae bacterium]|nr:DUF1595 domain-containing protein [Nannocystaceae bacterium]
MNRCNRGGRGATWALGALLVFPACYEGRQADAAGGAADGGTDGGDGADDGASGESGDAPEMLDCEEIGAQALRRVSSEQYRQILSDLLPSGLREDALAVSVFPATLIDQGFSTYASANTVSTNESIAIEDNADAIAEVFANGIDIYAPALVPCLSPGFSSGDIDGCVGEFISEFGAKAFRRPLTDGKTNLVAELYASIAASDGQAAGLAAVLQFFLQAPPLL